MAFGVRARVNLRRGGHVLGFLFCPRIGLCPYRISLQKRYRAVNLHTRGGPRSDGSPFLMTALIKRFKNFSTLTPRRTRGAARAQRRSGTQRRSARSSDASRPGLCDEDHVLTAHWWRRCVWNHTAVEAETRHCASTRELRRLHLWRCRKNVGAFASSQLDHSKGDHRVAQLPPLRYECSSCFFGPGHHP